MRSRFYLTRLMHSTGSREARKTTLKALHTNNRNDRGTSLNRSTRQKVPSTITDFNNNNLPTLSSSAASSEPLTQESKESNSVTDGVPRLKVVNSPERGPVELLENSERSTIVYTDASVKNGLGGIGVFFGDNSQHNVSERLRGRHDSSGFCEIIAAQRALESCAARKIKGPIVLRTDCLQIVEAMQKSNVLMQCRHSSEMRKLQQMALNYPGGVQFEHVYAHMNNYGNERADQLATSATNMNRRPSPSRPRSKPPSRRMQRRTRKVFVSRKTKSSPPKPRHMSSRFTTKGNAMAVGNSSVKRRSMMTDATQRSSRSNMSVLKTQNSSLAPATIPSIVEARERRQANFLKSDKTQRSAESKRSVTTMSTQIGTVTGTLFSPSFQCISRPFCRENRVPVVAETDVKTGKENSPARFTSRFASKSIKKASNNDNVSFCCLRGKQQKNLQQSKSQMKRPIIYKTKSTTTPYIPKSNYEAASGYDQRKFNAAKRYYETEADANHLKTVIDTVRADQELRRAVKRQVESKRQAADKPSVSRRSNKKSQQTGKKPQGQKTSKKLGKPLNPTGAAGQSRKTNFREKSKRSTRDAASKRSIGEQSRRGGMNKSNRSQNGGRRGQGNRGSHFSRHGGQSGGRR